jgi:hypothetical protein
LFVKVFHFSNLLNGKLKKVSLKTWPIRNRMNLR